MAIAKIFVAATGQHVGKTTSTLGLVSNLQAMGYKTGYCKPLGQKHVTVDGVRADKDALLFSKFIQFSIDPDIHSPVILSQGITKKYIEAPEQFNFPNRIRTAAKTLEDEFEIVVYEGTGHPGVGSVVDLSNAKVAKMLGAGVIMIVEGGIGNTIDRLNLSLALFREQQVPLLGVIVNKVKPEKLDQTRFYIQKKLDQTNIPLLGVVPYEQALSFPIMDTVLHAVDGKVLANSEFLNNRIEGILAGSLVDIDEIANSENILLVASIKRLNEAIEKIESISKLKNLNRSPLSGIIVTGDGRHAKWYEMGDLTNPYFREHNIPVITTKLDTYGSVVKISRIEVKINTRTPWKVQRAIHLIKENVDFPLILNQLNIPFKK
jgi:dethiobiotin synthetase